MTSILDVFTLKHPKYKEGKHHSKEFERILIDDINTETNLNKNKYINDEFKYINFNIIEASNEFVNTF